MVKSLCMEKGLVGGIISIRSRKQLNSSKTMIDKTASVYHRMFTVYLMSIIYFVFTFDAKANRTLSFLRNNAEHI